MIVAPPSDDQLRALLAEHAHRHPEKAAITVMERGEQVRIPILLGNPSGACDMPDGRPSRAWADMLAAALRLASEPANLAQLIVQDVVLYPDRGVMRQAIEQWPMLQGKIVGLLQRKLAIVDGSIEEPSLDEEPPDDVRAVLDSNPRAAWRCLKPSGHAFDVAISPPSLAQHRVLTSALKKNSSNPWPTVLEAATAALAVGPKDALRRWPGLAVLVLGVAHELAGSDAEVQLGEW